MISGKVREQEASPMLYTYRSGIKGWILCLKKITGYIALDVQPVVLLLIHCMTLGKLLRHTNKVISPLPPYIFSSDQ